MEKSGDKNQSKKHFSNAFLELEKVELQESFQPFNKESAISLDNWINSISGHYAAYKKQFLEVKDKSREKEFAFISTPHPIGNITAAQSILLNTMAKIENLILRESVVPKYSNNIIQFRNKLIEYLDRATWKKEEQKKFDQAIDNADKEDKDQLKQYKKFGLQINDAIESLVNTLYKTDKEKFDQAIEKTQIELAKLILVIGIPTQVINKDIQNIQNQIQEKIIQNKEENYSVVKSWVNVDADGDPTNPMKNILRDVKEDNTLEVIFKKQNGFIDQHSVNYESRISYEDKKGVKGAKKQLSDIFNTQSLKEISSVSDLLNKEKFKNAYNDFFQLLETETYQDGINSKLDFIIRVCAPAFKRDANGIILSDFNSSDSTAVPRLTFIKEATERYLKEKKLVIESFKINQSILPLCESEKSILGATEAFGKFLNEVKEEYSQAIKLGDLGRIEEIRKLICNKNGEFIYGFFAGPSDLTKDMGGVSTLLIDQSIRGANQLWGDFVKSWDQELEVMEVKDNSLKLSGTKFLIEYGRGTSPKRGGGIVVPGLHATTVQGTGMPTLSNTLLKGYIKAATYGGSEFDLPELMVVSKEFFNAAIKNHREFLNSGENGEEKGSIIKEFDELRSKPQFAVLERKYSNNQGTRGSDGVPTYANQRAINAATTTTYIGLPSFPSFPGQNSEAWNDFDLGKMLSDPHGIDIVIKELFQYCSMDFKRASQLGFSGKAIEESGLYVNNVLSKLIISANPEFDLNQLNGLNYDKIANKLIDEILVSKMPLDLSAKRSLEHFQEQIDFITNSRNNLSNGVNELLLSENGKTNEVLLANMAFELNNLANFQLPLISAAKSKEEINTKYWEAHKPNTKISKMKIEQVNINSQQVVNLI